MLRGEARRPDENEAQASHEASGKSFPEHLGGRVGRAEGRALWLWLPTPGRAKAAVVHVEGAVLLGPGPRAGATLRADVAAAFSVGDCGAGL